LLQSVCRQIRFETGDVLRRKGQHYQDMYVITDVCVEVDLESGREAAKVVLSHPGFPIGEISFLRGRFGTTARIGPSICGRCTGFMSSITRAV
jgi:hypothetical protein